MVLSAQFKTSRSCRPERMAIKYSGEKLSTACTKSNRQFAYMSRGDLLTCSWVLGSQSAGASLVSSQLIKAVRFSGLVEENGVHIPKVLCDGFLMPRESLSSWDYQPFKLFDWLTNTGGILDYLLDKNPLLKDTYNLIHKLRESLQENDSEAFKAQLAQS